MVTGILREIESMSIPLSFILIAKKAAKPQRGPAAFL
jgi:hypothetical protein